MRRCYVCNSCQHWWWYKKSNNEEVAQCPKCESKSVSDCTANVVCKDVVFECKRCKKSKWYESIPAKKEYRDGGIPWQCPKCSSFTVKLREDITDLSNIPSRTELEKED